MQRRLRRQNPKHLKWIAGRPCVICAATPCDAAHIKFADGRVGKPQSSNIGMKADDRFTLPLCSGPEGHHAQQHSAPERQWWARMGIDPVLFALALYSITGDGEAADDLIMTQLYARWEMQA